MRKLTLGWAIAYIHCLLLRVAQASNMITEQLGIMWDITAGFVRTSEENTENRKSEQPVCGSKA